MIYRRIIHRRNIKRYICHCH